MAARPFLAGRPPNEGEQAPTLERFSQASGTDRMPRARSPGRDHQKGEMMAGYFLHVFCRIERLAERCGKVKVIFPFGFGDLSRTLALLRFTASSRRQSAGAEFALAPYPRLLSAAGRPRSPYGAGRSRAAHWQNAGIMAALLPAQCDWSKGSTGGGCACKPSLARVGPLHRSKFVSKRSALRTHRPGYRTVR